MEQSDKARFLNLIGYFISSKEKFSTTTTARGSLVDASGEPYLRCVTLIFEQDYCYPGEPIYRGNGFRKREFGMILCK
jgi:hypothetical protein